MGFEAFTWSSDLPFFTEIFDAIADDGDHVAVIGDSGAIADASVAGDDVGTALFIGARNHDVEQAIERVDFAVDRTAFCEVDHRVAIGSENVAGADHVGAAEEDDAVAVCVRGMRMLEDDGFVVEERPFVGVVGIGGPELRETRRCLCRRKRSCGQARRFERRRTRPAFRLPYRK